VIDLDEWYPPQPTLCDVCLKPMAPHSGRGRPRKRHAGMCSDIERMRLHAQKEARRAERLRQEAAA